MVRLPEGSESERKTTRKEQGGTAECMRTVQCGEQGEFSPYKTYRKERQLPEQKRRARPIGSFPTSVRFHSPSAQSINRSSISPALRVSFCWSTSHFLHLPCASLDRQEEQAYEQEHRHRYEQHERM
jgi:hypothetical protein